MGLGSSYCAATGADEELSKQVQIAFNPPQAISQIAVLGLHTISEIPDLDIHVLPERAALPGRLTKSVPQLGAQGAGLGQDKAPESEGGGEDGDDDGQQLFVGHAVSSLSLPESRTRAVPTGQRKRLLGGRGDGKVRYRDPSGGRITHKREKRPSERRRRNGQLSSPKDSNLTKMQRRQMLAVRAINSSNGLCVASCRSCKRDQRPYEFILNRGTSNESHADWTMSTVLAITIAPARARTSTVTLFLVERPRIVIRMHLYGFKQSPHIALGRQGHASGPDQTRTGEGNWSVNGEDFSGSNSFPISLEPAGSATFVITGDSMVRTGYLEFRGDRPYFFGDLATTFFYQVKQGASSSNSIGTGPTEPGFYFAFPIQQNSRMRTGIAWVALAHVKPLAPEEIRIGIFDPEGAVFEIKTVPYEGYKAQFVDELFPDLPEEFQGTMMVNVEKFIHITVLRQDTLSSGAVQFTNTPPDRWCFDGDCSLDEASP